MPVLVFSEAYQDNVVTRIEIHYRASALKIAVFGPRSNLTSLLPHLCQIINDVVMTVNLAVFLRYIADLSKMGTDYGARICLPCLREFVCGLCRESGQKVALLS